MLFKRKKKESLDFEEVLLDRVHNPTFDHARMEGRMELPITQRYMLFVGIFFITVACIFLGRVFYLQVVEGERFRSQSDNNRIDSGTIIAERGVIYDRFGELLAWNEEQRNEEHIPARAYSDRAGLGQIIGYVSYPQRDTSGFFYRTEYLGRTGLEKSKDTLLKGENGEELVETNAVGDVISEGVIVSSRAGKAFHSSLDAELSEVMYEVIATTTQERDFRSGAGAIMDIQTGEIIALTSYPSYDPEVMADGSDAAAITALNTDPRFPFLNKVIGGVYTPGSIVKPFVAYAALAEGIIDPKKIITSTGSIRVPNPYNPDRPTIFSDWKAHGAIDLVRAIAVSSNVYFYYIGGGFEEQEGLGISRIESYLSHFGIGTATGVDIYGEEEGVVPTPEWKREVFDDDWRLGDTYLTAIGQFGFQSTPIQMLRAYAALANDGVMVTPHLERGRQGELHDLELNKEALQLVQEGMREAVRDGTARSLNQSSLSIAGKTGTAEIDAGKNYINSWVVGYFPYEDPQYAFIMLLEHGPYTNLFGAAPTMRSVFDWMITNRPEYVGSEVTS